VVDYMTRVIVSQEHATAAIEAVVDAINPLLVFTPQLDKREWRARVPLAERPSAAPAADSEPTDVQRPPNASGSPSRNSDARH